MPTPRPSLLGSVLRPVPVACALALLCAMALAIPGSGSPSGAIATVGWILITSLPLALAWMISARGLGAWIARWLSPDAPRPLACVLGAAALLWIDHLLGICGVLSPVASWAMLVPGFAGAIGALWGSRAERKPDHRPSWWILLGAPGVGLMIAAACLPPGSIWESEARGYDVLEYHLQLPKEWLAAGRVWPTDHNVYSFLPSSMEAVFARLGALAGIDPSTTPLGAGSGIAIHAAQMLHVLFALLAAWTVGAIVKQVFDDPSGRSSRICAIGAACAMLSVPWVVVTGSMAYNEMAVCAMLAAALLATLRSDVPSLRRGIAVGILIGAACSLKPTAIFMAMPPAAIALAARTKPREWFGAFGAASMFGAVMIAPWLIRNGMASGNPVFPSVASVFGPGSWSDDQHARWSAAHHLDLSIIDRLGRLASSEFGLTHAQWSIWVFVMAAGVIACLFAPTMRRSVLPLAAGIAAQIVAWMSIGHLQSRFLIPTVVPGAIVVGIALGAVVRARPRLGVAIAIVVPLTLAGDAIRLFFRENTGAPNRALTAGVEVFNASGLAPKDFGAGHREGIEFYKLAGPVALINHAVLREPGARVVLVGDATPLYFNDAGARVVYTTPWDIGPLERAMDAHPDDLDAAIAMLRDEHGFTHILLNLAELDRVRESGYTDPRLTSGLAREIARRMRVVMTWPDRGQILVTFEGSHVDSPVR